jgi:hypothetical protein
MTIEATLSHVHKVTSRWRARRLDPPDIEVATQELPEDEPDPGLQRAPGAGETPGLR